jgi:hypothetical protein
MRVTIEAGWILRREFRRYLLKNNYQFTEEKGWLDSVFYIEASPEQQKILRKVVELNS